MDWQAWLTLAVVGGIFFGLIKDLGPPDMLFLGGVVFLALAGIITPTEAFAGFSNAGMLTVAFLFVVAAGLRETGFLDWLGQQVLGKARTERGLFVRLTGIVLPLSAFLNNTPIVAMFVPIVLSWSRRHRVAPSRLLIPLSYLAILGGTCTLIGTSTNLVVNGLMIDANLKGMHLFEITAIGLPYALIGVAYLVLIAPRLLPDRREMLEQLGAARREFLVEMLVDPGCRLIGKSIEEAGLRHLPGLFLIEINREGTEIGPVAPEERLQAGDRLVFTGIVSSIVELERIPGLVPAGDPSYEVSPSGKRQRKLCEAVISPWSPLIGKTIRGADFRTTYGAAVVAVHRDGVRLENKIGDIRLKPGDTLLLQTHPSFLKNYRNDRAFYLISNVSEWRPIRTDRLWIAVGLFAILIFLMTSDLVSTVVAAAATGFLMVATGCISASEARRSIEWQVLVTIAAAFGIGTALQNSGAAAAVVDLIFGRITDLGPLLALAIIYFTVSLITELITNNAAAVLMFPFCLKAAEIYNVSPRPFMIALILAASASFVTPIGYQTNMMVYGPGGYRFGDFVKVGMPLNLLLAVVAIVLIPFIWPF
jgi:di/tricarboxylate transporter